MPIFEYVCCECDHEFEVLTLSANDPDPTCPQCRADHVSKLMSVGCVRPRGIATGSGGFKEPACRPASR